MDRPEMERAIGAATSVAASLGLAVSDAALLHNSNKLTLRLTPCDVVARVAPAGHEGAQREIEFSQRLVEAGCPVGLLEPRVDPLVYSRDGFAVTLWTYYEPVDPHVPPADYARALKFLHTGMREVAAPIPSFTDRVDRAQKIVSSPDLSPQLAEADRAFLGGRLQTLRESIGKRGAAEQLLHGEPHHRNVLSTNNGPLFIDLETLCRGPVEFDLAHVSRAVCENYPNVDHELLDECRQLVLAIVAAWRWELGDQFPRGWQFGKELLRALDDGPPWPTLDTFDQQPDDR